MSDLSALNFGASGSSALPAGAVGNGAAARVQKLVDQRPQTQDSIDGRQADERHANALINEARDLQVKIPSASASATFDAILNFENEPDNAVRPIGEKTKAVLSEFGTAADGVRPEQTFRTLDGKNPGEHLSFGDQGNIKISSTGPGAQDVVVSPDSSYRIKTLDGKGEIALFNNGYAGIITENGLQDLECVGTVKKKRDLSSYLDRQIAAGRLSPQTKDQLQSMFVSGEPIKGVKWVRDSFTDQQLQHPLDAQTRMMDEATAKVRDPQSPQSRLIADKSADFRKEMTEKYGEFVQHGAVFVQKDLNDKYEQSEAYLRKNSPTASRVLDTAQTSTMPQFIVQGDGTNVQVDGDRDRGYSLLKWNPDQVAADVQVATPGTPLNSSNVLAHELSHGITNRSIVRYDILQPNADYDNFEERRVITGIESKIAFELGQETRSSHAATLVPAPFNASLIAGPRQP